MIQWVSASEFFISIIPGIILLLSVYLILDAISVQLLYVAANPRQIAAGDALPTDLLIQINYMDGSRDVYYYRSNFRLSRCIDRYYSRLVTKVINSDRLIKDGLGAEVLYGAVSLSGILPNRKIFGGFFNTITLRLKIK